MSDTRDEDGPAERELPSDFLRGQFREWMDAAVAAGKTRDLFELEMWLRSFERFFRIKNQPLSEKETKQLALRNWSEELRLVDNVILRTVQLCTSILTEDQVNLARFDKYVESYLKKDDVVDPYIEKLVRQSTPESGLTLLREALEDLHTILMDLTRLSGIAYPTDRKHGARVFLELFRLLHYLEYADPAHTDEDRLKNSILIFSLITSETRLLLTYLERRVLKTLSPDSPGYPLYDSFVYCLPFELKKVINTELLDISVTRQPDIVRARVENSHGILKDCFQQSVVQLAQAFDAKVEGIEIFPDFTAKLEQSVGLRDSLARLIRAVRRFQASRAELIAVEMKEEISLFYDHNMKDLMYRDWSGFELFFIEILKCTSLPALSQISHRFETFLMTLFREVQKRSILQNIPAPENLLGV